MSNYNHMEELNTFEIGLQFLFQQLTIYDKFYYHLGYRRITQSENRLDTVRDNLFHNNTKHQCTRGTNKIK